MSATKIEKPLIKGAQSYWKRSDHRRKEVCGILQTFTNGIHFAKAISSAFAIDFPQLRHFTQAGLIEVFISRFKIYQNIIQRRIKGRTEILWDS